MIDIFVFQYCFQKLRREKSENVQCLARFQERTATARFVIGFLVSEFFFLFHWLFNVQKYDT